uniref:Uncharacterized protein n=1 Tax=Avena sativa TaxID=4498 RepID=A0ACD5X275_AVESA
MHACKFARKSSMTTATLRFVFNWFLFCMPSLMHCKIAAKFELLSQVSRPRAPLSLTPLGDLHFCLPRCRRRDEAAGGSPWAPLFSSRAFSSRHPAQKPAGDAPVPSAVDHKSIMPEDKFHKLADDTIHDLLEKLEEYGDSQQMDGFDIDYGNQVLTLRLGDLGTDLCCKQANTKQTNLAIFTCEWAC